MSDLTAAPGGELRITLQIKRAATGETETVELIGHSDPAKLAELLAREREKHAPAGGAGSSE